MSLEQRVRPAAHGPAPHNIATQRQSKVHSSRTSVPRVAATCYPPSGRRTQPLLIVRSCVLCGGAHAHRGSEAGGLRDAGCGKGAYYLVPRPALTRALAVAR